MQGCVSLSQALHELLATLETELRKRGLAKSVLVLASPETELPALLKACGDRGLRDRFCSAVSGYLSLSRFSGESSLDASDGATSCKGFV